MVLSGQLVCIGAKVFLIEQSGCTRAKVVVLGQKLLYSGKSGCIWTKVVVYGQIGFIRANVVLFGQKLLLSGKVVVFGQSDCNLA